MYEGDVLFAAFPCNLFIYEVQGTKFCMDMSYHSKQQVKQDFFPKMSRSPGKQQNWIVLFSQNGRCSEHVERISFVLC